jgi:hypothetical protein
MLTTLDTARRSSLALRAAGAEFDVRAVHEASDSSDVELGAPRAVPAGGQNASATEDFRRG